MIEWIGEELKQESCSLSLVEKEEIMKKCKSIREWAHGKSNSIEYGWLESSFEENEEEKIKTRLDELNDLFNNLSYYKCN